MTRRTVRDDLVPEDITEFNNFVAQRAEAAYDHFTPINTERRLNLIRHNTIPLSVVLPLTNAENRPANKKWHCRYCHTRQIFCFGRVCLVEQHFNKCAGRGDLKKDDFLLLAPITCSQEFGNCRTCRDNLPASILSKQLATWCFFCCTFIKGGKLDRHIDRCHPLWTFKMNP